MVAGEVGVGGLGCTEDTMALLFLITFIFPEIPSGLLLLPAQAQRLHFD